MPEEIIEYIKDIHHNDDGTHVEIITNKQRIYIGLVNQKQIGTVYRDFYCEAVSNNTGYFTLEKWNFADFVGRIVVDIDIECSEFRAVSYLVINIKLEDEYYGRGKDNKAVNLIILSMLESESTNDIEHIAMQFDGNYIEVYV